VRERENTNNKQIATTNYNAAQFCLSNNNECLAWIGFPYVSFFSFSK